MYIQVLTFFGLVLNDISNERPLKVEGEEAGEIIDIQWCRNYSISPSIPHNDEKFTIDDQKDQKFNGSLDSLQFLCLKVIKGISCC